MSSGVKIKEGREKKKVRRGIPSRIYSATTKENFTTKKIFGGGGRGGRRGRGRGFFKHGDEEVGSFEEVFDKKEVGGEGRAVGGEFSGGGEGKEPRRDLENFPSIVVDNLILLRINQGVWCCCCVVFWEFFCPKVVHG